MIDDTHDNPSGPETPGDGIHTCKVLQNLEPSSGWSRHKNLQIMLVINALQNTRQISDGACDIIPNARRGNAHPMTSSSSLSLRLMTLVSLSSPTRNKKQVEPDQVEVGLPLYVRVAVCLAVWQRYNPRNCTPLPMSPRHRAGRRGK